MIALAAGYWRILLLSCDNKELQNGQDDCSKISYI